MILRKDHHFQKILWSVTWNFGISDDHNHYRITCCSMFRRRRCSLFAILQESPLNFKVRGGVLPSEDKFLTSKSRGYFGEIPNPQQERRVSIRLLEYVVLSD